MWSCFTRSWKVKDSKSKTYEDKKYDKVWIKSPYEFPLLSLSSRELCYYLCIQLHFPEKQKLIVIIKSWLQIFYKYRHFFRWDNLSLYKLNRQNKHFYKSNSNEIDKTTVSTQHKISKRSKLHFSHRHTVKKGNNTHKKQVSHAECHRIPSQWLYHSRSTENIHESITEHNVFSHTHNF